MKVIHDKEVVKELFSEVVPKIGDRPGGYTRVIKLGNRIGDAASMSILELVDYNDVINKSAEEKKEKREEKRKAKAEKEKKEEEKEEVEEAKIVEEIPKEEKSKG